ncbi:MAG TPA: VacJ family lipoprotein [Sulfurovum sp.]
MKLLNFSLFILFFSLQGCSTKEAAPATHSEQSQTQMTISGDSAEDSSTTTETQTDEFSDEFEEEFAEKETNDTFDPLSGYNRAMTSFNDQIIIYGLTPLSKAYAAILPQPLRLGISNFVHNIQFPIRFANNLLQGKFKNSADELGRFMVNSTVGLGGLMDPAEHHMGVHPHEEDFGQTLGHYGVGSGFHVVIPFIGPSNVRDIVGITADGVLSPLVNFRGLDNYKIPDNIEQTIGIYAIHLINKTSLHLGEYEDLRKDAVDLYPFLRDIYEQKRDSEIAE